MDEQRLKALIDELDKLVPRAGAFVLKDKGIYGASHDPAYIGNRLGYLRLGIELLKVGDAPHLPGWPNRVTADLSYLVNTRQEQGKLTLFERRDVSSTELISESAPAPSPAFMRVLTGLVALFSLLLLILGMRDFLNWLGPQVKK